MVSGDRRAWALKLPTRAELPRSMTSFTRLIFKSRSFNTDSALMVPRFSLISLLNASFWAARKLALWVMYCTAASSICFLALASLPACSFVCRAREVYSLNARVTVSNWALSILRFGEAASSLRAFSRAVSMAFISSWAAE